MTDPIRLALVGCGWISNNHVRAYRDLMERGCDTFTVTAVVDPQAEAAARQAEAIGAFQGTEPRTFGSIEALVGADAADAADLCIPHCFHHTAAAEALAGDLHVLLEKPLGLTVAASRSILAAARERGKVLATAENVRRTRTCRACAWAMTQDKAIGEVRAADVVFLRHSPLDLDDPKFKWRAVKTLTGGGMIMDSGAHLTDMMLVLFGEPESIYCTMSTLAPMPIADVPILGEAVVDVEDEWHAVICFKNGVRLTWTFSRVCPGDEAAHGKYYGSDGTFVDTGFVMHPFQGGGEIHRADGSVVPYEEIEARYLASLSQEETDRLFPYGATDGFSVEVWDFIHAIATGDPVELDGEAGLRAKALSIACYESATLGAPVRYDDVLAGRVRAYQEPIDAYWQLAAV